MKQINAIRKLLDEVEKEITTRPTTGEQEIIDFMLSRLVAIIQHAESFENKSGKDKSYKSALSSQKSFLNRLVRDIELWQKHGLEPDGK